MVLLQPNAFFDNPFVSRDDVEQGIKGREYSSSHRSARLPSSTDLTPVLDPLQPHTSPGGACIDIGSTATHYDTKAVALEAFARPLWGLTPLLMGGGTYDGTERWVRGLASGTDPTSPEYWGASRAKDQRMVEMSPLSFAIALAPDVFYHVSPVEVGKPADVTDPNARGAGKHCRLPRVMHDSTHAR